MGDFKYDNLTAQEQADAIRSRLAGLERDHLNVSLDVEVAGSGGNPAQESRLKDIESKIEALRKRAEKLEGAAARDGA